MIKQNKINNGNNKKKKKKNSYIIIRLRSLQSGTSDGFRFLRRRSRRDRETFC